MGGEDNTLAGFALLQTIVDVIESYPKVGFVHPAYGKIIRTAGQKAGGGNSVAFVGDAQEVKISGIVEQPVRKGVRRAEVDPQNHPAVLNELLPPGRSEARRPRRRPAG